MAQARIPAEALIAPIGSVLRMPPEPETVRRDWYARAGRRSVSHPADDAGAGKDRLITFG